MGQATCVVVPSQWYETFGRVIAESFAKGTPVIVSRLGAMQELVRSGENGHTFEPGNAQDLAAKVHMLFASPVDRSRMRGAARRMFEANYTAERNYRLLLDIYAQAQRRAVRPQRRSA